MIAMARTPRLRPMWKFAEDEVVLPNTGPKGGRKFKCDFQPFTRLWFEAIASGLFTEYAATGPSQSGKTLSCHVIPIMYHLFERRENVIGFAPGMDICEQKWLIDVRPVIAQSRYAEFLPKRGGGSQGGFDDLIQFTNGVYLNWKTGGGGDKNKSAITAKVACGTEVNGMAVGTATSLESSPLNQIRARLRSHGSRARMYLECTVDVEQGIIWQAVKNGTDSKIVLPCPHCHAFVTPEREDFIGWENATNELEAEVMGFFHCPACGGRWTPEQRKAANMAAKLIHKGQEISVRGEITGPIPQTRTFGFRWSAVNNLFAEESLIGSEEWEAARNPDRDSAEKERCQFVWCQPFESEPVGADLDEETIASRLTGLPQCVVPDDIESLVCKIDLHDRRHYWAVMATGANYARSFVDYGITNTPYTSKENYRKAIKDGLKLVAKEVGDKHWKKQNGDEVEVDLFLVDGGYEQDVALEFVLEMGPQWIVVKGKGDDYKQPKEAADDTRPGNHYYESRQPACEASKNKKWWLIISETNYWMKQVHAGFAAETFKEDGVTRREGSIALFGNDPQVHLTQLDKQVPRSSFAVQLMAWKQEAVITQKYGERIQFVLQHKDDHFSDCSYDCLVAHEIKRKKRSVKRPPRNGPIKATYY